jgi:putative sterol carrier protein
MWQSIIPKAPEDISVDEFFTKFVPDQFSHMNELINAIDLSFLTGSDFKIQFEVEGKVYAITFKNEKEPEVTQGSIEEPDFTVIVTEKDWRDAVTGKFSELADDFTVDPISFIDARHYDALMSMNGTINMNLKKKDGVNLPLRFIFNGEESPSVTINLDMLDALHLMNKSATGLGLLMNGKLKFAGSMLLLMKLQNFI